MMKTCFARSPGVTEKTVGRDVALYVRERRSIHVLNATARFVWESLREPMTEEELALVLARAFGLDRGVAIADLHDTLSQFTELGLVVARRVGDGDDCS